jgi:hypothetical protein
MNKPALVESIATGLGVLLLLNGLYMLLAPQGWYFAVPGVPDRGSYNVHFIRDIGIIYSLCGVALAVGSFHAAQRLGLWSVSAAWLSAHALFHFWEVAAAEVGVAYLLVDFPGVTLPALVNLALIYVGCRPKAGPVSG